MKDPKNAQKMLELALKDFKALQNMTEEELFDIEIFGFHAQQTVEKLLKSWLSAIGVTYERTHDLQSLFSLLYNNNQTIPADLEELQDLTDFAVTFRYDVFESLDADIDRNEIIKKINKLSSIVKSLQ